MRLCSRHNAIRVGTPTVRCPHGRSDGLADEAGVGGDGEGGEGLEHLLVRRCASCVSSTPESIRTHGALRHGRRRTHWLCREFGPDLHAVWPGTAGRARSGWRWLLGVLRSSQRSERTDRSASIAPRDPAATSASSSSMRRSSTSRSASW